MQAHLGQQAPGPGQEAPRGPVIRGVREDHGESEMTVSEVSANVYEPG